MSEVLDYAEQPHPDRRLTATAPVKDNIAIQFNRAKSSVRSIRMGKGTFTLKAVQLPRRTLPCKSLEMQYGFPHWHVAAEISNGERRRFGVQHIRAANA